MYIALLLLIICALYYKIHKKAVENRQKLLSHGRVHSGTTAASDTVIETRLEVRMAKTVGLVIMFMVIIWVPVLVVELVYAGKSHSCIQEMDVVSVWKLQ